MATIAELLSGAVKAHQAGKLADAERIYRQVLQHDPGNVDALHLLGVIAQQVGRHELAVKMIGQAIERLSTNAVLHANLGEALRSSGQHEDAIASYQRALLLDPENSTPRVRMGHAQKNLGRMDEARESYLAALQIDPRLAEAYNGLGQLASMSLYTFTEDQLEAIGTMLGDGNLSARNASTLHFTLADRCHAREEYDLAFEHYRRANELSRQSVQDSYRAFDAAAHVSLFDRLIETFDSKRVQEKSKLGVGSQVPVFVVGMPRSGTTLVEQILASHPLVFGAGELKYMSEIVADLPSRLGAQGRFPDGISQIGEKCAQELATG